MEYTNLKNKMLKSIYENEGFGIGQYEVGYEQGVNQKYRYYNEENVIHSIDEIPIIKANAYPYTFVTVLQAEKLAENFSNGKYTSSLMYGLQWDLLCKYLSEKNILDEYSINYGNYRDTEFTLNRGKYCYSIDEDELSSNWNEFNIDTLNFVVNSKKLKTEDHFGIIYTTGAVDRNCTQNIYDLAGNVRELTLKSNDSVDEKYVSRGGMYYNSGIERPNSYRNPAWYGTSTNFLGFRVVLY